MPFGAIKKFHKFNLKFTFVGNSEISLFEKSM